MRTIPPVEQSIDQIKHHSTGLMDHPVLSTLASKQYKGKPLLSYKVFQDEESSAKVERFTILTPKSEKNALGPSNTAMQEPSIIDIIHHDDRLTINIQAPIAPKRGEFLFDKKLNKQGWKVDKFIDDNGNPFTRIHNDKSVEADIDALREFTGNGLNPANEAIRIIVNNAKRAAMSLEPEPEGNCLLQNELHDLSKERSVRALAHNAEFMQLLSGIRSVQEVQNGLVSSGVKKLQHMLKSDRQYTTEQWLAADLLATAQEYIRNNTAIHSIQTQDDASIEREGTSALPQQKILFRWLKPEDFGIEAAQYEKIPYYQPIGRKGFLGKIAKLKDDITKHPYHEPSDLAKGKKFKEASGLIKRFTEGATKGGPIYTLAVAATIAQLKKDGVYVGQLSPAMIEEIALRSYPELYAGIDRVPDLMKELSKICRCHDKLDAVNTCLEETSATAVTQGSGNIRSTSITTERGILGSSSESDIRNAIEEETPGHAAIAEHIEDIQNKDEGITSDVEPLEEQEDLYATERAEEEDIYITALTEEHDEGFSEGFTLEDNAANTPNRAPHGYKPCTNALEIKANTRTITNRITPSGQGGAFIGIKAYCKLDVNNPSRTSVRVELKTDYLHSEKTNLSMLTDMQKMEKEFITDLTRHIDKELSRDNMGPEKRAALRALHDRLKSGERICLISKEVVSKSLGVDKLVIDINIDLYNEVGELVGESWQKDFMWQTLQTIGYQKSGGPIDMIKKMVGGGSDELPKDVQKIINMMNNNGKKQNTETVNEVVYSLPVQKSEPIKIDKRIELPEVSAYKNGYDEYHKAVIHGIRNTPLYKSILQEQVVAIKRRDLPPREHLQQADKAKEWATFRYMETTSEKYRLLNAVVQTHTDDEILEKENKHGTFDSSEQTLGIFTRAAYETLEHDKVFNPCASIFDQQHGKEELATMLLDTQYSDFIDLLSDQNMTTMQALQPECNFGFGESAEITTQQALFSILLSRCDEKHLSMLTHMRGAMNERRVLSYLRSKYGMPIEGTNGTVLGKHNGINIPNPMERLVVGLLNHCFETDHATKDNVVRAVNMQDNDKLIEALKDAATKSGLNIDSLNPEGYCAKTMMRYATDMAQGKNITVLEGEKAMRNTFDNLPDATKKMLTEMYTSKPLVPQPDIAQTIDRSSISR